MSDIRGELFTIDHIIPLNGDNVCGLHVPENLQIMLNEHNILKGNKHEQSGD